MFDYNLILVPKNILLLEVGKLGAGFCLSQISLFSIKNENVKNASSIVTSLTFSGTSPRCGDK